MPEWRCNGEYRPNQTLNETPWGEGVNRHPVAGSAGPVQSLGKFFAMSKDFGEDASRELGVSMRMSIASKNSDVALRT